MNQTLDKLLKKCSNYNMKRIYQATTSLSLFLFSAANVYAQIDAGVKTPANNAVIAPKTNIGSIIGVFVSVIAVAAVLAALIFILIGAFQWITSGGDKGKVEAARNHIIAAIIGLVIVVLSFVIINVITQILGIGSIADLKIPTLQNLPQN